MHLEDFHCLVKNRLPVSFKNPLSNRIADLVPDNFVISTANKKLVLQEKQAKPLSDTASNEHKNICMLYFRPRATKDSWVCVPFELMLFLLLLLNDVCVCARLGNELVLINHTP